MTRPTHRYRYLAYDGRGKLVEGRTQAQTPEEASDNLWRQGLSPFEVREDQAVQHGSRGAFRSGRPTRRDVAAFTREFSTLSSAEIPLDDTLRIIAEQPGRGRMRPVVENLLNAVIGGASFSEALAMHPETFQPDYVNVARAGEVGSDRARVFGELAELLERRQELASKTTSAFIYPLILIVMAIGSMAIVMGVLVPSLAPIFAEGGRAMPTMISWIIGIQQNLPALLTVISIVALLSIVVWFAVRRSPETLRQIDRIVLKLPFAGIQAVEQNFARFSRTLGSLLRAGVPMLAAFSSARAVVLNREIGAGLEMAGEAIRNGETLANALSGRPGIPAVGLRMVTVGQDSARLDQMLVRVALMLEQQAQRRTDRLMTMLTPALTVLIALVVGGLIYTVMNAVLSVSEMAAK
jgi:general secretion pathway protein F